MVDELILVILLKIFISDFIRNFIVLIFFLQQNFDLSFMSCEKGGEL